MAKATTKDAAVAPVVDVKFKDLRVAVVALNESKLMASGIKLVGISKNEILDQFMKAVEGIPDGKDGKFPGPKAALDFYNKVLDLQEAAKKGVVPPAPPAAAPKTKAGGAAEPKAKEKKEKGDAKPKAPSQTDFIRTSIKKRMTRDNLIKALAKEFGWDDKAADNRLKIYEKAYGAMGKDDKKLKS